MRLYVETNFLLHLALQQEQAKTCEKLLASAEAKQIRLLLPAISVFEAFYKIRGNGSRRRDLANQISGQLADFGRSRTSAADAAQLSTLLATFRDSEDQDQAGLATTIERVLKVGEILTLGPDQIAAGLAVATRLDLEFPDALVYSSIVENLSKASTPSLFATTNKKDFATPEIEAELSPLGCELVFSFDVALAKIAQVLKNT